MGARVRCVFRCGCLGRPRDRVFFCSTGFRAGFREKTCPFLSGCFVLSNLCPKLPPKWLHIQSFRRASARLTRCRQKTKHVTSNLESIGSKHVLLFSHKLPPRLRGASATRTLHQPYTNRQNLILKNKARVLEQLSLGNHGSNHYLLVFTGE